MDEFDRLHKVRLYLHQLEADLSLGNLKHIVEEDIPSIKKVLETIVNEVLFSFSMTKEELLDSYPRLKAFIGE